MLNTDKLITALNFIITILLIAAAGFQPDTAQVIPEKGVPSMQSFTPADYGHKGKIWDIDSAPNGIVYMASDKGLLEYDGKTWNSFRGSEGITRSVEVVNDSVIYTGSDRDFGIWKRNAFNIFEYTSLYPFKEDLSSINEEFWDIYVIEEKTYFISSGNVYVYSDDNLTKVPVPSTIQNSFKFNNNIYLKDERGEIVQFEDLTLKEMFSLEEGAGLEVLGLFEDDENIVLVTENSGLFNLNEGEISPITNELSQNLKSANVFSFEQIGDSYLAFGTIMGGLYISDNEQKLVHLINKSKGLQNSTILSTHYSENGKLWLGMDYGVSFIDLANEYTFVYDFNGNFGTAYSAVLWDETFYLGSNQGLYTTEWNELNNSNENFDFELLDGSEGQVWSLDVIDGQIFMSHDHGLFTVKNKSINRLWGNSGVWTTVPYKEYLLAGTYNGISIFEKRSESWSYLKQMELIAGSANQVMVEGDELWVNIPNYGIIKARLNSDLYPEDRKIFKSGSFKGEDHFLKKENGDVNVITNLSRYKYSRDDSIFTEIPKVEDRIEIDDLLLRNREYSEINDEYEFYPVYNGFALRNLSTQNYLPEDSVKLVFREIQAYNNQSRVPVNNGADISYRQNNLSIEAIVPNEENVRYQFWANENESWTEWSTDNEYELIGMDYGKHTIKVRARVDGDISQMLMGSFQVLPPWYLSGYAYFVYLLFFGLMLYGLYLWINISLDKQRKVLLKDQRKSLKEQKEKFQQRLKKVEQQKLKAENENLKAELRSKTIELAAKAKESDEKNNVLQNLREKLNRIEDNPGSVKRFLKEIKQIIDTNIGPEDNTFELQIDELHQDFFDKLRKEFPDLTRYDLRLCAYIRIGLESKEISDLLNIKPSSVYISRSRLRKKLDIQTDEDLHSYLNSI